MVNIQSSLSSAPDLCENDWLTVLIGRNHNSYRITIVSNVFIYAYILQNLKTLIGQRNKKYWDSSECRVSRKSICVPFWETYYRFFSPAIEHSVYGQTKCALFKYRINLFSEFFWKSGSPFMTCQESRSWRRDILNNACRNSCSGWDLSVLGT